MSQTDVLAAHLLAHFSFQASFLVAVAVAGLRVALAADFAGERLDVLLLVDVVHKIAHLAEALPAEQTHEALARAVGILVLAADQDVVLVHLGLAQDLVGADVQHLAVAQLKLVIVFRPAAHELLVVLMVKRTLVHLEALKVVIVLVRAAPRVMQEGVRSNELLLLVRARPVCFEIAL